jgi:AI-2 transport protein TqsA
MNGMQETPESHHAEQSAPAEAPQADRSILTTTALCLVIAVAGWYLLKELAPLFRPLLLATFICYVIVPAHLSLTQRVPRLVSVAVLAIGSAGLLALLALMLYVSAMELNADLPGLIERAQTISHQARDYFAEHLPPWLAGDGEDTAAAEAQGANHLRQAVSGLVAGASEGVLEALEVGLYLIFLLLEAGQVPDRVRHGFRGEQADRILAVVRRINAAMASYLRVKMKTSLGIAVSVTVVLWAFGVKFAVLWGVLTFCGNFIPYVGSIITCSLPMLLAFLQMDFGWRPITVGALLIALHTLWRDILEPRMTGKEVGLSPVVILIALGFWGLCWGLTGLVLAIPLTVMLKIILDNISFTQPLARLMAEE